MKITTLRNIDMWVGRPLCWLLTGLYFGKRLFAGEKIPEKPTNILFIKLFGAGSIILAHPTVDTVRKLFPDSGLYFLTFSENEPVLSSLGAVPQENILTVRNDNLLHLLSDVLRCLKILIGKKIDVVIDLEFFSRFTAVMSLLIGSKLRIGFYGFHTEGLRRGKFINGPVNYNHTLHTARAFFTLLRPLGVGQNEFNPVLPLIPASSFYPGNIERMLHDSGERVRRNSAGRIIISPGSSELSCMRRWPEKHFIELARLFTDQYPGYSLVFIGSAGEKTVVDELVEKIRMEVSGAEPINLSGKTTIENLIDLCHYCDLMIANDSGAAHLAALARIPTITIFGPETPELYAPLNENGRFLFQGLDCQPCISIYNGKLSYCIDNQCLKQLRPRRVIELAGELLNRGRN